MKIGKNRNQATGGIASLPQDKANRRNIYSIIIAVVTAILVVWVYSLGLAATKTVEVIMLSQNIYKNQQIVESNLHPYSMLKAEYDKYSTINADGTTKRRVLLWDERDLVVGTYAAYPLKKETYAEYSDFITSRTDNSDNVLYSFPGKNTLKLSIEGSSLTAFKSYLKPGDRLTIIATYTEDAETAMRDEAGGFSSEKTSTYHSEPVLKDLVLADMLNSAGDSILDLYSEYNTLSTYQQAARDADEAWQTKTEPATILVALTPEEEDLYYFYQSKQGIKFEVSMPQRIGA